FTLRHPEDIDPDLPVFLSLSYLLTGFDEVELQGTGMLETYYCVLMKEDDQEGVRGFLKKAREILNSANPHQEIKKTLIEPPVAANASRFDQMPYQGLAQRIILLWYTGIWTTMNWSDKKSQQERTAMVSAEAYKEGLIWAAAETHPAGAKQPGYNSWSQPPVLRTRY
ncbi:MAG: hypothetical protein WB992_10325, partial [Bryobacteraceae bacterium]